jgi:hypothetical protein
LVSGPGRGRKRRGVEIGQRPLGLVEPPHQEEAPDFEVAGIRSVDAVAVRFKRRARRVSNSERRRVIAQGDPLQRAEEITRRECACRGRDQRIHRNPATLVTPTISTSGVKLIS